VRGVTVAGARETPTFHRPGRVGPKGVGWVLGSCQLHQQQHVKTSIPEGSGAQTNTRRGRTLKHTFVLTLHSVTLSLLSIACETHPDDTSAFSVTFIQSVPSNRLLLEREPRSPGPNIHDDKLHVLSLYDQLLTCWL
jgi:hypothetical protein